MGAMACVRAWCDRWARTSGVTDTQRGRPGRNLVKIKTSSKLDQHCEHSSEDNWQRIARFPFCLSPLSYGARIPTNLSSGCCRTSCCPRCPRRSCWRSCSGRSSGSTQKQWQPEKKTDGQGLTFLDGRRRPTILTKNTSNTFSYVIFIHMERKRISECF